MGIYNFQKRFVPFIESGAKTHTIRSIRRHPDKLGNTVHLYTGLRTKKAKLLMRARCVKIESIKIHFTPDTIFHVSIDGEELNHTEKEALARRDGFHDFIEMMCFWDGRLPFVGHVIHWKK